MSRLRFGFELMGINEPSDWPDGPVDWDALTPSEPPPSCDERRLEYNRKQRKSWRKKRAEDLKEWRGKGLI